MMLPSFSPATKQHWITVGIVAALFGCGAGMISLAIYAGWRFFAYLVRVLA